MQGIFGSLRGQIARDLFVLEMCLGKFYPQNHPSLYRDTIAYGVFEGSPDQMNINAVTAAKRQATSMRTWFHENVCRPYNH